MLEDRVAAAQVAGIRVPLASSHVSLVAWSHSLSTIQTAVDRKIVLTRWKRKVNINSSLCGLP